MRAVDIIMKKREGKPLNKEEISFLIKGYVSGEVADYQISAFCMAVFFRGMTPEETGVLTDEMIASGEVFNLSSLKGPLVDKHSTGGVGDKVSLILAPIVAACGVQVPMMSGRGLGHTGGTLDKLESIPGYSTAVTPESFLRGIEKIGFMMTGQSEEIVPADRQMYALRDVTATVESIPLITASILSKKFAEGAEGLIFDVKCGKGAFMKDFDQARALAKSLVDTGRSLGKKIGACITRMDEPLGRMIGNFLEVEESVRCLEGQGPTDLMEVTLRLSAWMLVAGGLTEEIDNALTRCREVIENGKALDCFYKNVEFQGGDVAKLRKWLGTARAPYSAVLYADQAGFVAGIDAMETGLTAVDLGAGRNRKEDNVLPLVGIELLKKSGDRVEKTDALCRIFAEDPARAEKACRRMRGAYSIEAKAPESSPIILEEMRVL